MIHIKIHKDLIFFLMYEVKFSLLVGLWQIMQEWKVNDTWQSPKATFFPPDLEMRETAGWR